MRIYNSAHMQRIYSNTPHKQYTHIYMYVHYACTFMTTVYIHVHVYPDLPIIVCGCQDNRGAGVCIACDPRTVNGEQHHEHHHESTQVAIS